MFNLYRVPLNVLVAKICTSVGTMNESTVFATCSVSIPRACYNLKLHGRQILLIAGALLAFKNDQLLLKVSNAKED